MVPAAWGGERGRGGGEGEGGFVSVAKKTLWRGGGGRETKKKMLSAPLLKPAENESRCYYPHRSRDSVSPVCGIFIER